jgi:hypothetical protein
VCRLAFGEGEVCWTRNTRPLLFVITGLAPVIDAAPPSHCFKWRYRGTAWMAGSSPAKTKMG